MVAVRLMLGCLPGTILAQWGHDHGGWRGQDGGNLPGQSTPPLPNSQLTEIRWIRDGPQNFAYWEAQALCSERFQDAFPAVCTLDEICPVRHQGGEEPVGGFAGKPDSWVPVGDEYNSWVQTGIGGYWQSCMLHRDIAGGMYGPPWWGFQEDWWWNYADVNYHFKGDICCSNRPIQRQRWIRDLPSTSTWDEAKIACQSFGAHRLCTRAEICPNGHKGGAVPDGGYATIPDSWVPTNDFDNSWVQTGGRNWDSCLLHNEIAHGAYPEPPEWGRKDDETHFRRDVCCHQEHRRLSEDMNNSPRMV